MPHSLYLGSGIVQPRLRQFDSIHGGQQQQQLARADDSTLSDEEKYRPSLAAIRSCLKYSIVELAVSLFTFALFVNSAILIVAGSSLSSTRGAESADLFSIHELLSTTLAPVAGTMFGLALLLSGTSAGVVCTIAGQMVSEGQLRLRMPPWARRLLTRSISITPSIIIAGAVGADGLSAALEGSQVALSVILPFVSAPLLYFTCREQYMTVATEDGRVVSRGSSPPAEGFAQRDEEEDQGRSESVDSGVGRVCMKNHWVTSVIAALVWLVIVLMNVALLVLAGLGIDP